MTEIDQPTPTARGVPYRAVDFRCFAEALDYAAEAETGANFFSSRGALVERLPYRQLRAEALEVAQRLIAAGLQTGDRVAILAESDGDFLRAFAGCQYGGLIPVPLPLPVAFRGRAGYIDQIRRMMAAAGATAALAPRALRDWIVEAAATLPVRLAGTLADLPPLHGPVSLPRPGTDGIAYLQFSSGSTRFPMGVAVTHDAFIANTAAIARHGMAVRPEDRCTSWLPFYHDLGLVGCLLTPIVTQMSVDILPTQDFVRRPLTWLSTLSAHGGTVSFAPTFGYELCLRRTRRTTPPEDLDLSRWRAAGIGGDMVRPGVLAEFAARFAPFGFSASAFLPCYGMAEVTVAISFPEPGAGLRADRIDLDALEGPGTVVPAGPDTARARRFVHCGKVLPGHALEVRDAAGNRLPERRLGRFFLRGPSLMQGYFGRPEETAAVLGPDGWLDTGDLGYLCDGAVVVTGRAKDLIIVNGRNLWPQDLEWSAEREVAGLQTGDAAAVSVDTEAGETVVLLAQCRLTDPAARAALRAEIAGVLSALHGVDCTVVLVPHNSLPRTSSGKLSRARTRQLYLGGRLRDEDPATAGAS